MPSSESGGSSPPQPRIRYVQDIVRALQRARGRDEDIEWGGVTFLIGAGCSKSAGVPLGVEISRECALDLARKYSNRSFDSDSSDDALAWLQQNGDLELGLEWPSVYGELFQNHLADPSEQRRIIRGATDRATGINWAHLCLGELVHARYVHTVLTTNFDQLVLEGIVRTGIIPVVADGIEALNRVDGQPAHPQVVHLHGSRHTYHPRNSRKAVEETNRSQAVVRTLSDLLRSSPALIVVGYAGAEEGVMKVLVDAAQELRGKTIFWCQYGDNPDDLSLLATELLSHSPGGGLLVGQDADEFFAELMRGVGLGMPRWIKQPISHWRDYADRVVIPSNPLIQEEMEDHSRVLDYLATALDRREKARGRKRKLLDRARELALQGEDLEAVELFEQAKPVFESWRDWRAFADAALRIGEHSPKRELLETAARAYEQAISGLPSGEDLNERRAELQNNLGVVFALLGEREGRTQRLKQAIEAYQAALDIHTNGRLLVSRATTQNNLGNALAQLGEREKGTERLEQAVEAYRLALEVRTRRELPLNWAATQNNLGNALLTLGEREEGTERLEQAVDAYRSALEVYTQEQLPLDWAMAQINLGAALRGLGERQGQEETLGQAVATLEEALEVDLAKGSPWLWAEGLLRYGEALGALGKHRGDAALIGRAREHLRMALEAYLRFGSDYWADKVRRALEKLRSIDE